MFVTHISFLRKVGIFIRVSYLHIVPTERGYILCVSYLYSVPTERRKSLKSIKKKTSDMKKYFLLLIIAASNHTAFSQNKATITIDASKLESKISPDLHGIFFEEISHGGEGGL